MLHENAHENVLFYITCNKNTVGFSNKYLAHIKLTAQNKAITKPNVYPLALLCGQK